MALFVYIGTGAAVFFSNPKSTNFGGWCCYCAGHGWLPLLLLLAAAAASATELSLLAPSQPSQLPPPPPPPPP